MDASPLGTLPLVNHRGHREHGESSTLTCSPFFTAEDAEVAGEIAAVPGDLRHPLRFNFFDFLSL